MNATMARQLDRAREQLESILRRDQMPADPVVLAEALGLDADEWQAGVLRSESRRLLLNVSRQLGKSTITAVLALHRALYVPRSMIVMGSPGERQSKELFRKTMTFYRRLGRPVPAETETTLELELANESRIVALPGNEDTVRSYSAVTLLLVDEASRVPDELMDALRPMLSTTNGQLIAMSTPKGKRGWWYEAWANGGDGWDRVLAKAEQCPRISREFLESERRTMRDQAYRAEYGCEFTDALDSVFSTDDIRAALDASVLPLFQTPAPEASRVLIA